MGVPGTQGASGPLGRAALRPLTVRHPVVLPNHPDTRVLRVEAMRRESDDVISIELVDPDGRPLPSWTAGAHIDLSG